MFSLFKKKKDELDGMRRFRHRDAFTLVAPAAWQQDESGEHFSLVAPGDAVSITGSAYAKEDGSLEDFAAYRFSSVQDFYAQIGDERSYAAGGRSIIVREFEGTWPGESQPTYYVVACIETQGIYASLGFVTTRAEFAAHRKLYDDIIASLDRAA